MRPYCRSGYNPASILDGAGVDPEWRPFSFEGEDPEFLPEKEIEVELLTAGQKAVEQTELCYDCVVRRLVSIERELRELRAEVCRLRYTIRRNQRGSDWLEQLRRQLQEAKRTLLNKVQERESLLARRTQALLDLGAELSSPAG